jgi:hypothetical protein
MPLEKKKELCLNLHELRESNGIAVLRADP